MNYLKTAMATTAVALLPVSPVAFAQDDNDAHHEIDHIVVTATLLERTVEQLAQPTSVLRGNELTNKQSTSIGETLSQEPGLSSTYFGPVSSRPVIRGQFGERVRILSNGLDSLDGSALSADHQVTAEGLLAKRIEIVRGPATLLYGSGAAGGLVNIVDTRLIDEQPDEPFSAGLALGADTAVGNRYGGLRAHFGAGNFGFSADYFSRSTDNIDIPGFAESRVLHEHEEHGEEEEHEEEEEAYGSVENTDSETSGGALGVSYFGERGFLGISASGFDSKYGIPGHHHHHEEEEGEEHGDEEEESVRIDLEQFRVDVVAEYAPDNNILSNIRFRAAINDYEHTEFEGAEVGTVFDIKGHDGRLELRHAKWGPLEGALGVQFKRTEFDAIGDEAFLPASNTERKSLFMFEELQLADNWVLQGSARYEQQTIAGAALAESYDEGAFGASLGAVWRPLDELRVSANIALTERHPNAAELYADGPHIAAQRYERGSVTTGSGTLDKEQSLNLDVTVHGDMGYFEWSITGFVNAVDEYILLRPTALEIDELQVYDYDQADVEFSGVEAEALFELWDSDDSHVHLRTFADFVRATEDATGSHLPRIPPRRLGIGLHGNRGQFDGSIDVSFVYDQDDVAENELHTEAYKLLSANLSYTFTDSGLYVFLRGTNLLDEDIRQHSSPLKDLVPLPGRSLHAGLRFEF